ncbi:SagB/ThcOx family dehydrogenase [Paucisalibacillus globulus]|uniref:SagB/ThcOx family dehydrogenase n=1 Tax=Paucisalibacillus globulus TaxID=351095 RepID=UPI000479051C|nr:SagB/ThcOx family dehydrogenase [Paucisalibacillus globulus]
MKRHDQLWDLTGKRNTLRELYHQNAMISKHYHSMRIKPVKNHRKWELLEAIPLDEPKAESYLEQMLFLRRTIREVSGKDIDIQFISKLLKFSVGITGSTDSGYQLFSYPSPGTTYATTVFISIAQEEHIYIYRYNAYDHSLEKYAEDLDHRIADVIFDKKLSEFPILIFLASDYQLIEEVYGEIAYRLLCLEMGHMAQNITLYSLEKEYHSVCIGGYNESLFKEIIGKQYDLHYVVVVG